MTATTRIRWEDAQPGTLAASLGYVGSMDKAAFRIYGPDYAGVRDNWLGAIRLNGYMECTFLYAATLDGLKAEAERWLEEFVSSIGAIFPAEPALPPVATEAEYRAEVEEVFAPGCRVSFQHPDNGYDGEGEAAALLLTLGGAYTVAWSDIGSAKTRIGLEGITGDRGQGFNSVLFEPAGWDESR